MTPADKRLNTEADPIKLVDKILSEATGDHNTMTAGELVELLRDVDPQTPVYFAYNYGDHARTSVASNILSGELAHVEYSDYHRMMMMVRDGEADGDDDGDHAAPPEAGSEVLPDDGDTKAFVLISEK